MFPRSAEISMSETQPRYFRVEVKNFRDAFKWRLQQELIQGESATSLKFNKVFQRLEMEVDGQTFSELEYPFFYPLTSFSLPSTIKNREQCLLLLEKAIMKADDTDNDIDLIGELVEINRRFPYSQSFKDVYQKLGEVTAMFNGLDSVSEEDVGAWTREQKIVIQTGTAKAPTTDKERARLLSKTTFSQTDMSKMQAWVRQIQDDLHEKNKLVIKIHEQNTKKDKIIEKLNTKNSELEEAKTQLQEKNTQLETENQALKDKIVKLEEEIRYLKEENSTLTKKVAELEETTSLQQKQIKELNDKDKESKERITTLESTTTTQREEIITMKREARTSASQLRKMDKKMRKLAAKLGLSDDDDSDEEIEAAEDVLIGGNVGSDLSTGSHSHLQESNFMAPDGQKAQSQQWMPAYQQQISNGLAGSSGDSDFEVIDIEHDSAAHAHHRATCTKA